MTITTETRPGRRRRRYRRGDGSETDGQAVDDRVTDRRVTRGGAAEGPVTEGRAADGQADEGWATDGRVTDGRAAYAPAAGGWATDGRPAAGRAAGGQADEGWATDSPATVGGAPLSLQVNALQAMCRQVFGFRLAMIAVAAPAALLNAAPGMSVRLVGAAVVVTFMGSYVLFRDWERFGPLLLRHPSLLAADTLFGTLLLISAGPDTTLAYVSVCTPLLAGIVYGWRGAACFASLQSLILLLVHATLVHESGAGPAERLLLPGFCVITGAVGSALRQLMLRFGTATQALTTVKARLAVTEAVAAERARLAREMHDSVAKTLHGVALAADALAQSAGAPGMDPARVRQHAELVARAARRAAAESRELLTDLRRDPDPAPGTDFLPELASTAHDFTQRTGLPVTTYDRPLGEGAPFSVPPAVARQLLTITSEALENAHRHAAPTHVELRAAMTGGLLTLSVRDDGRGLPPGTTLEQLRRTGHFGLVGMVERAASIGARIHIGPSPGPGPDAQGTEVRVELPLAALTTSTLPTPPTTTTPYPAPPREEAA
ncbi:histidine kinase [Streptomyces sp. NBC_01485]|uniref:sensor histidine kinase n=1 Tax=Streptomyces sp. NBC_01485 TaxID=2903884 RepID=UPI002E336BFD|nr:histidine kinase [Streptomyces sp. NBC_01485]